MPHCRSYESGCSARSEAPRHRGRPRRRCFFDRMFFNLRWNAGGLLFARLAFYPSHRRWSAPGGCLSQSDRALRASWNSLSRTDGSVFFCFSKEPRGASSSSLAQVTRLASGAMPAERWYTRLLVDRPGCQWGGARGRLHRENALDRAASPYPGHGNVFC